MALELIARVLETESLQIDPAYQRNIVPARVKWIVNNYSEVSFGRLLVGERRDGTCWVVDGQQRFNAAVQLEMSKVPCLVFQSSGRSHEAKQFKDINSERTNVRKIDVFRAALEAREEETVAINAVTEEMGFRIGSGGTGASWNIISGVGALEEVVKRGGIPLLQSTLKLIKDTWSDDPDAVKGILISGISYFLFHFQDRVDYTDLKRKLKRVSPLDVVRFALDYSKFASGGGRVKYCAEAIMNLYNKGKRTKRLTWNEEEVVD